VLLFLLPFVALYELGSLVYLARADGRLTETVAAYALLARFFEVFGAFGLYLPGLALCTVLGIQSMLSRERPHTSGKLLLGMAAESIALALPLLLLAFVLGPRAAAAVGGQVGQALPPGELFAWPWPARMTIAVGAGLYEELLFRMVLIALIHALMADALRTTDALARGVALGISALAFGLYHDLTGAAGGIDASKLIFFVLAGLYFGAIYMLRGFGIVVGCHIAYDAFVLGLVPAPPP
jgi:hypothetical protein